jgi:hypothetical protein
LGAAIVSESQAEKIDIGSSDSASGWFDRLSICLPLVFLIGVPAILATRAIFLRYHPENFVDSSPTISETASHPPASLFFLLAMLLVTVCILISWSLNIIRSRNRLALILEQGATVSAVLPTLLYTGAGILGMAAGLSLASLAIYNLNDGHDIHMKSSWAFYICQAVSITLDILFVFWMRRLSLQPTKGDGLMSRAAVAAGIFIGSWFFLYMYLSKDSAAPEHRYAVQLVYVGAEYVVAVLFLAYPATVYRELRQHFRETSQAGRMD